MKKELIKDIKIMLYYFIGGFIFYILLLIDNNFITGFLISESVKPVFSIIFKLIAFTGLFVYLILVISIWDKNLRKEVKKYLK